ncbi:hypothetical protein A2U01_0093095, partial [Trifolium medium]|nr:hypothetical protein [Trifolium medium]
AQPTWRAAQLTEAETALNKARARNAAPLGVQRRWQQMPKFGPKCF